MEKDTQKLFRSYPKDALKGKSVALDANWKKGFVAFMAMGMVNIDLTRKAQALSAQISDEFNEAIKTGKPISQTATNLEQLRTVIKIKNLLAVDTTLRGTIEKLNADPMEYKNVMDQDIYTYYVGAKTVFLQQLNETQTLIADIDNSVSVSFKNLDVDVLQKETLVDVHTNEDVEKYKMLVFSSLDLKGIE